MKLDKKFQRKLEKEILEIVGEYLNTEECRLFFFGSRATEKGTKRSDIDIGIEGKEVVPLEKMELIQEEVDNLETLYTIEIVDFKNVSEEFKETAKKNIILFKK